MKGCLLAVALLALGTPAGAQWLNHPTPGIPRTSDGKPNVAAPAPRTPDGKPDLSGLWTKISPKYSRNVAADLKSGEIQPWALEILERRKEDLGKDYMNVQCVPLGPGYATSADSTGSEMVKIVQTPGLILMLNPDLTYRQVFLDGRALESAPNPSWMGYSVGRWDGDTLVVQSFGFNDRTWLDHDGHPHTEQLRVTERYRRPNFGRLEVEVTFADPGAYARPWSVALRAELAADTEMIEFVCNENVRSLEHWVGKASDERKGEVQVSRAILGKYVGTYEEQAPLWRAVPRTVTITLAENGLLAEMDGRGPAPLIATSPTAFSGLYGLGVEFVPDGAGGLYVKHVSGNYWFSRK
jgi:hypothetical protein